MNLLIPILSHICSIGITMFLAVGLVSLIIGLPYCRYTFFVSHANTSRGIEEFAKFLAKKAGIHGNSEDVWKTFIPAAQKLSEEHIQKRHTHLQ